MLRDVKNQPGTLPLSAIEVGPRLRPFNQKAYETVRANIAETGYLIEPLSIRKDGGSFKLAAGLHRYEAVKSLGWTDVAVRVFEADSETEAGLVELDENLSRANLTAVEEAVLTGKREKLFLKQAGEKYGRGFEDLGALRSYEAGLANGAKFEGEGGFSGQKDRKIPMGSFIDDTAAKTKKSEKTVRRNKKRATVEGIEALQGTEADKPGILDALVTIKEEEPDKVPLLIAQVKEADNEEKAKAAEAEEADRKAKEEAEKALQAEAATKKAEDEAAALRAKEDEAKAEEAKKEAERLAAEEAEKKRIADEAQKEADAKREEAKEAAEKPKAAVQAISKKAAAVKTEKAAKATRTPEELAKLKAADLKVEIRATLKLLSSDLDFKDPAKLPAIASRVRKFYGEMSAF